MTDRGEWQPMRESLRHIHSRLYRAALVATCLLATLPVVGCGERGTGILGTAKTPSPDATLSTLAISTGTLTPSFAAATTSYAAAVPNATSSVTITPTTTTANATVTVNGATVASGSASTPISLVVGTNTISVSVTAEDGTTKKAYTISVLRATT